MDALTVSSIKVKDLVQNFKTKLELAEKWGLITAVPKKTAISDEFVGVYADLCLAGGYTTGRLIRAAKHSILRLGEAGLEKREAGVKKDIRLHAKINVVKAKVLEIEFGKILVRFSDLSQLVNFVYEKSGGLAGNWRQNVSFLT